MTGGSLYGNVAHHKRCFLCTRLPFNQSHDYYRQEFFSADNSLGVLPLSIAMMASHISGITMLGMSGESYIRGMIVVLMYTTGIFIVPLMAFFYLPIFFELKVVSIYEVIVEWLHEQYRLTSLSIIFNASRRSVIYNTAWMYNRMH